MGEPAERGFSASSVLLTRVGIPQSDVVAALRRAARIADVGELADALAGICADPFLEESIRLASPVLAAQMQRLAARDDLAHKKVRRILLGIAKYAVRTVSRPTPFGIFAGVALAQFGEYAAVRFGSGHRRVANVSPEWHSSYARQLAAHGNVDPSANVAWNNLAVLRADRVHLPVRRPNDHGASEEVAPTVKSLKTGPAVEAAAAESKDPLPLGELVSRLCRRFPALPAAAVEQFCRTLISEGYLLSSVLPDNCTARIPDHELLRNLSVPEQTASAVVRHLESYASGAPSRLSHLAGAEQALTAVHGHTRSSVQVDSVVDAQLTLPQSVADDAARAIEVTLRTAMNPPLPRHLRGFHRDFVEKFGIGLAVPVLMIMDELTGIGIPPAYRNPEPGSPRMHAEGLEMELRNRDARLISTLLPRIVAGCEEIVLDPDDVESLAGGVSPARPDASEIALELWADSVPALDRGDYRLLAAPVGVFTSVGAVHGRFGHMFEHDDLWLKFREWLGRSSTASEVQLHSHLTTDRIMNVGQVPSARPSTIAVGTVPLPTERPGGIARVGIMAMPDRLFALDLETGEPLRFALGSMVDPNRFVPNVVRLLLDVTEGMNTALPCWDWGVLGSSPYLPRVRLGSVIMARARWLIPDSLTSDVSDAEWMSRFDTWCSRVRLPRYIQVKKADLRLSLDVAEALDRQILRSFCRSNAGEVVVEEDGDGAERNFGWSGGRPIELVVSARRTAAPVKAIEQSFGDTDYRLRRHTVANSKWIYLKVYGASRDQNRVLTGYVAPVVAQHREVIDKWFYIRYTDPQAHLRIRVKVTDEENKKELLFALLGALGEAEERYVHRTIVDVYEPEVYRYGGIDTIDLAETLFQVDSLAALNQLALLEGKLQVKSCVLSGIQMADIAMTATDYVPLAALTSFELRDGAARKQVRSLYEQMQRSGVSGLLPSRWLDGSAELDALWLARRRSLGQLFERLAKPRMGGAPTIDVLFSLLHMSHNRLVGGRASEEEALGVCAYLVGRLSGRPWN